MALLFTPGPLSTHPRVRQALQHDLGSRDERFVATVRHLRHQLLELGGATQESGWECVIVQGSGTFGVESVLGSCVPPHGAVLVLANGAYGRRMAQMCQVLGIEHRVYDVPEYQVHEPEKLNEHLQQWPACTHVALVHSETTTGLFNPIHNLVPVATAAGKTVVLDAMSSFGGVPLNLPQLGAHFVVSSSNKCIEGVPGFSFVLAQRPALEACRGQARSLSLDLFAQWQGLESNGQFRFTPPTHSLMAFAEALNLLHEEGGVEARARRYARNAQLLIEGLQELGFVPYLQPPHRGYIISTFLSPHHPNWVFPAFYDGLSKRGFVIYPGKLAAVDSFRIGSIGQIYEADVRALLAAVQQVLADMHVPVPVPAPLPA